MQETQHEPQLREAVLRPVSARLTLRRSITSGTEATVRLSVPCDPLKYTSRLRRETSKSRSRRCVWMAVRRLSNPVAAGSVDRAAWTGCSR